MRSCESKRYRAPHSGHQSRARPSCETSEVRRQAGQLRHWGSQGRVPAGSAHSSQNSPLLSPSRGRSTRQPSRAACESSCSGGSLPRLAKRRVPAPHERAAAASAKALRHSAGVSFGPSGTTGAPAMRSSPAPPAPKPVTNTALISCRRQARTTWRAALPRPTTSTPPTPASEARVTATWVWLFAAITFALLCLRLARPP